MAEEHEGHTQGIVLVLVGKAQEKIDPAFVAAELGAEMVGPIQKGGGHDQFLRLRREYWEENPPKGSGQTTG